MSTYMYILVHTNTYEYIHVYTSTLSYILVHTSTYEYIHVYISTLSYISLHTSTYQYILSTYVHIRTYCLLHIYYLYKTRYTFIL